MKINIETLPKKNRLERLRADDFELGLLDGDLIMQIQ